MIALWIGLGAVIALGSFMLGWTVGRYDRMVKVPKGEVYSPPETWEEGLEPEGEDEDLVTPGSNLPDY